MADRPSVKDILAAVRGASPAPTPASGKPATPKADPKPPESVPPASGRTLTVQEKLAAARAGKVEIPKAAPTASAAPEVLETPEEGFASVAAIESVEAAPIADRPLSIREKLAAARTGGAAQAATPSRPTASPAPGASGRPLSIQEKLAAAKSGGGSPAAATPMVPKAPRPAMEDVPTPSKGGSRDPKALAGALRQAADAKAKAASMTAVAIEPKVVANPRRRGLLIVGGLVAALGGGLAWLVRKVMSEPAIKIKVGPPSGFQAGAVRVAPDWDFAVVRRSERIVAIRSACTHLGCPTRWVEADAKFRCPCHGSAFDAEGRNIEGPAPRPLERYKVSLSSDGQVVVDRGRTFREELGEWDDPASFVSAG